ncbi:MAG: tetratricopeptide repeat protein, partial [Caldilineae bacterium]
MTAELPLCPVCKTPAKSHELTCSVCGYSLLTVCRGCQSPVQMQFSYCPYCGRPLDAKEILPTYRELQEQVEKNRSQLFEYANDLTKLYLKQRQLEQYLPTGLLDKVMLSDSQVVGERRYVTVLFTDVVGFTQLSAHLDPEEVFMLMNNCFRLLVEQVYKFGGSVDKFIGDAMMAIFGAPVSYGNDAERAVRAAIAMQEAIADFNQQMLPKLGKPFQLRIGISTGDAIAGTVGVEGQWSYTVMGNTVNMASRLQSAARVGGILVNQEVYQQTRNLIEYRILPPISLKGIGDSVPVFEVMGELSHSVGFRQLPSTQLSRFVGRGAELAKLQALASAARQHKRGGIAFVTGEAGLGKTRLMWEWQCRLPEGTQVWFGQCQSLTHASYEVWRQIIFNGLSLEKEPQQTVASVLLEYLGDEKWLPFLETLLFGQNVLPERFRDLEPEQLKDQIFVAVLRLLTQIARRHPLVIFVDNLQWIDQLSGELLQSALPLAVSWPVLFCIGSRPEAEILPSLLHQAEKLLDSGVVEIALPPLSPAESEALLQERLPLQNIPERLKAYILERGQNNPYFLEELASFIMHSDFVEKRDGRWHITDLEGLSRLSLPGTLRGLIRARLDRLPGVKQRILSYGAVIGPVFPASLLMAVLRHLPQLTDIATHLTELVQEGILAFDGANYRFVHNSVYETVYQSLLLEHRRQMHQRVGEEIEKQLGGAPDGQYAEQLAYHFTAAENPLKAVPYLLEAGRWASQRFATRAALDYYQTALRMLPQTPQFASREADIHGAMGDLHQLLGDYDRALEAYRQALEQVDDANRRADYSRLIGQIWQWKGDTDRAWQWFEKALGEMAHHHTEITPLVRGRVYADVGLFHMHRGDYVHAERW